MKKAIFLIIFLIACYSKGFSQRWYRTLPDDNGKQISGEQYFRKYHALTKSEVEQITKSHYFFMVFELDSEKNISNVEIFENPDNPVPDTLKKYTINLFRKANGKWKNRIDDPPGSDKDILFIVSFLKADQTPSDRIKETVGTNFYAMNELRDLPRLKGFEFKYAEHVTLMY